MCEFNTKITIAQLLRLTSVSAKSTLYSPRRGYLSPGNSIVLEIAATLFYIHQRHNFLLILALILLKLKNASNRPVYFREPFLFQLRACKQDTQFVSQSICN